jgi:hypothetical protein
MSQSSLLGIFAAVPGLAGTAVFVILIIIVASGLIAWSFWNRFQRYRRENALLAYVEHVFASQDAEELDTGAPNDSITGRFISDIQRKLSPRDAADLAEQRDTSSFASVLGNTLLGVLLIIGLAGTLLSFKDALGEPPTLGEGGSMDPKAVDDYSRNVYSGMTGAFWPSFWGIAATVIFFSIRGVIVNRSRDALLLELEEFGYRLFERINPPHPDQFAALISTVSKLDGVASKLEMACQGLATSNNAAETSAKSIVEAAQGLGLAVENMNKSFADRSSVAKRLSALAQTIERLEGVVGTVGEQTGSLKDHLHGTSGSVDASLAALKDAQRVTLATVGAAEESLKEVNQMVLTTQKGVKDSVALQAEQIEQTKNKLEEGTRALRTSGASAFDAIKKAGETLQENLSKIIAEEGGKINARTETITSKAEEIARGAKLAADTAANTIRSVKDSADQMAKAIRNLTTRTGPAPGQGSYPRGPSVVISPERDLIKQPSISVLPPKLPIPQPTAEDGIFAIPDVFPGTLPRSLPKQVAPPKPIVSGAPGVTPASSAAHPQPLDFETTQGTFATVLHEERGGSQWSNEASASTPLKRSLLDRILRRKKK